MKRYILSIAAVLSVLTFLSAQVDAGLIAESTDPASPSQDVVLYYKFKADYNTNNSNDWNSQQFTIKYPDTYPLYSENWMTLVDEDACFSWTGFDAITTGGFHYVVFADFDGGQNCSYSNGSEVRMFKLVFDDNQLDGNVMVDFSLMDAAEAVMIGGFGEPAINNANAGENIFDVFENQTETIILPINLKSFSAKQYTENAAILNWTSLSEINASYYEVQRSIDRVDWNFVGQVKAKGSEFVGADYELIDDNLPLTGRTNDVIYYYRLKMVDLDGAVDYSAVEAVSFDGLAKGSLFVYPNPTADEVFVSLENVADLGGQVAILDRSGKMVHSQQLRTGEDERVSLVDLPTGLYTLAVSQAGELFTEKVIKID